MNNKIYNNVYKIIYTNPYSYSIINKTVIIQNLDHKFRLNGQIGIIKKHCKYNYFIIKLINYLSLKSNKQIFLKLHYNNLEVIQ